MERMEYNFTKELGLNFGKEKWALLHSFVPKRKVPDYYHKTRGDSVMYLHQSHQIPSWKRGLSWQLISTIIWDSDVSISDIFRSLSVNMVSASYLEDDGEDTFEPEELIQSNSDPWIKHLNTLWDTHFGQREPPTEDKRTQVNLGDKAYPKPLHKGELVVFWERRPNTAHTRVYTCLRLELWICPGIIPRMLCIVSTSIRTPNQSNNSNDDFVPRSWKQSKQRWKSS